MKKPIQDHEVKVTPKKISKTEPIRFKLRKERRVGMDDTLKNIYRIMN